MFCLFDQVTENCVRKTAKVGSQLLKGGHKAKLTRFMRREHSVGSAIAKGLGQTQSFIPLI
jgi:hypothetical protein